MWEFWFHISNNIEVAKAELCNVRGVMLHWKSCIVISAKSHKIFELKLRFSLMVGRDDLLV